MCVLLNISEKLNLYSYFDLELLCSSLLQHSNHKNNKTTTEGETFTDIIEDVHAYNNLLFFFFMCVCGEESAGALYVCWTGHFDVNWKSL